MKRIRKAARTIILDVKNNKTAVLDVENGNYHKIPGGGIEEGESEEAAAIREAREEGACDVELIKKIGEAEFIDPNDLNLIHHSVCFLAKKIKDHKTTSFTKDEKEKQFKLLWVTFEEAIKLFENPHSRDPYRLEMNNRDIKFILTAREYLLKNIKYD